MFKNLREILIRNHSQPECEFQVYAYERSYKNYNFTFYNLIILSTCIIKMISAR